MDEDSVYVPTKTIDLTINNNYYTVKVGLNIKIKRFYLFLTTDQVGNESIIALLDSGTVYPIAGVPNEHTLHN